MRVVVLHNSYQQRGGEDAVVDAEAMLLREAGHDVELIKVSNNDIVGWYEKVRTAVVTAYDAKRRDWIAQIVKNMRAEVLHVHNFFPLLTPAVHEGGVCGGAAVVQTLHNYRLLCVNGLLFREGRVCEKCVGSSKLWSVAYGCYRGSSIGSLAVARMQRRVVDPYHLRYVHQFIALTEFARRKFVQGGLPEDRVVVKPNFVPRPRTPGRNKRQGALFVGRLSVEKGASVLIDAWHHIPNLSLRVVGAGPELDVLKAKAPSNVEFVGPLPPTSVLEEMKEASMLIVPSVCFEGLPVTILEAFSVGLPVVASRIGAIPDVVHDGVHGALFSAGDANDLARVVSALNPEILYERSSAVRLAYEKRYAPEKNLAFLESAYRSAIVIASSVGRAAKS